MNYFCRQASQLASDSLDRSLSVIEYLRMRMHWLMCRSCHLGASDMKLMHELLKQPQTHCLPEDKREQILRVLKRVEVESNKRS